MDKKQDEDFLSAWMILTFLLFLVAIVGASEPMPEPKTSPYEHFVIANGIPLTVYRNEEGQLLTCQGEEMFIEQENLIPTNDRCW